MADSIDIYMNRPQRMNHIIGAHDVRGVASRRVGKTESIGDRVFQVGKSMPQGMGAWGGISRAQLYCKLIPGALTAMSRFYGLTEGTHYGAGKPPSWVPKPIANMKNYSDAIWFANGFIWQMISMAQVASAWLPLLYAGGLSSGVAYTLQIAGQKGTDPTIASLLMSLESVFSALSGFFILQQVLSGRELIGCALMFAAIIITQMPQKKADAPLEAADPESPSQPSSDSSAF